MKAFLSNQRMSFLLRSICFLFLVSSILNTFVSSTQHLCHSEQRDALLEFKSEFSIQEPDYSYGSSYPKTESWVNTSDCCSWDGITCAAKSGKVIGLDLSDSFLHGPLKSNSSLFRLRHLRHLNLAGNNFNNSQIPIKLLQLTKLVSLDLSSSRDFSSLSIDGSFLHLLAQNLRNLRELDMSNVNISSEIPQQFSNMRFLRSLHFTNCSLFGEFPSSVLLIPSLQSIRLSDNINLRGNLPVFSENNSLVELTIINTTFSGLIPDSISSLKHLTSLILSLSKFSGKIPFSLGNLSHLSHLDLSSNSFVGELPSSIGNLQQLTDFEVSANKLSGNLPASILNLTQLRTLSLSSNQFTGSLPPIISQFSKLESFYADDNPFTGAVLSSLVQIPSLTTIRLSYNEFDDFTGIGNISLLPNLEDFYVGSKNYNKVVDPGVVDLNVFSPLKKLEMLSLSGIPLSTANITSDSVFSSNLAYLDLPGCNITEFPEFIRNGRYLEHLDLSNNKIKGQLPDWLWRLPMLSNVNLSNNSLSGFNGSSKVSPESQITMVDLSSNDFQGPLFIPPSKHLNYFLGSKNNFTGEIPRSVCGLSSLEVLDLSNNNLNGSIPWCLETLVMSSLSDLNLRNNRLSDILPEMFQNAKSLITLDVSQNRLEGKMPASLGGCSALEVLNVGSNTFNDMFPFHLNSLQKLQVLVLRSNMFRGTLHNSDTVWFGFPRLKIIDVSSNDFVGTLPSDYLLNWTAMSSKSDDNIEPEYITGPSESYYTSLVLMSKGVSMEMERILTIYTAIDFSGNQLHGPIPDSVGLLKELRILNMSNNAFTGHIPSTMANLTNLESLDLSQNKISGEIPPELGTLSSLEVINVSHNQLEGSIPQGTQFQRQNCSSYEGNPGLNGPSLKDVCGDIKAPPPPQPKLMETKEEEEEESFTWVAAGLGFAPGVVFGLAMGYIVASYKHEWFMKFQVLVLRSNKFHGTLHNADGVWFGFPQLKIIDVSYNDFFGTLPSDYFLNWTAMSSKSDDNIEPEYIRSGSISYYFSLVLMIKGVSMEMERIHTIFTAIDFSGNQLHGTIPDSIGLLKELRILNLSSNAFTGHIPSSLANLTNLESLDLSQNMISGESQICGLSSLEVLDLSDNNLQGSIPRCLETLMRSLSYLNLRNNRLNGILPEIFHNAKSLTSIDISHNRLEGKIPASLVGCSALEVLNVASNTINDIFPFHLSSLQKLQVLVIRSNKFHGTLHNADGVWFGFSQLKIIDVSYNDFFGTLPSDYFLNWTAMSSMRDNNIEPEYIRSGSGSYYFSLVLMIKGVSMEMERILTIFTAIDFSGNQLHGTIPDSVGLLKELRILNMSSNDFTGHIPSSLANLTNLESLDLSQNNISGTIPSELGTLSSLEWINVSHNQLVGSIPQGTQFQRQNCSSYEGNPGLDGPSLKDVCGDIKTPPQPELVETKEEEEEEESLSWVAAGVGFGPGVVFGLAMGYITTSYKHEWFMKIFGRTKQQSTRTCQVTHQ